MGEWWNRPWVRRHATAAPFGIIAMTALLTWLLDGGQWQGRDSATLAASMVDLGAALYAAVAVLFEKGGSLVFWAWEQHKKRMAIIREELLEIGREEGREIGRKESREEGRKAGREESAAAYRAHLERIANEAREKGITLESLNGLARETE